MKKLAIASLVLAGALWCVLVLRERRRMDAARTSSRSSAVSPEDFRRNSRGEWVIPPLPDAGRPGGEP